MDVKEQIAKQVERLPADLQQQVLRFATSLVRSAPVGENGAALRQFAFSLDAVSAGEMSKAIEEECERIDAAEW